MYAIRSYYEQRARRHRRRGVADAPEYRRRYVRPRGGRAAGARNNYV